MEPRGLAFASRFVLAPWQRHHGREGDAATEATVLNAALNRLHDKLGAPADKAMALIEQHRSRHSGWNVKHFHSRYQRSAGARSYSWEASLI